MRVLVATDGSPAALEAARVATRLLRADARIEVVAVIPEWQDPMEGTGGFAGPVHTDEEADADYDAGVVEGGAAVAAAASVIDEGIETEVATVVVPSESPAGRAIVDLAVERGAELIVLGAKRRGFLAGLFTRSAVDEVLREAPCPVLLVPDPT